MSCSLGLRVLSTSFTLEGLTAPTYDELARDWSRCLRPSSDPYAIAVSLHGRDGAGITDLGGALAAELTRDAVENLAGQAVIMHAAGLSDSAGRVLALVGASGAGKSSAARLLCQDRFGYVSDETVAIDESGHVLPYPKPLSLDRDPHTGQKLQRGPDALGLRPCPSRLKMARLVLLERSSHPGPPRLERLLLDEAIVALAPQTSSLTRLDEPLQTLCRLIDLCGGVYRLDYTEITDAAELLEELLASAEVRPEEWAPEPVETDANDVTWAIRDGKVRQRPVQDAVRIGDGVLLLVNDRPALIRGIGTTLWHAAASAATPADLRTAAVAAHGGHPQADELVAAGLSELCAAEVLAVAAPVSAAAVLAGRAADS